MLMLATVHNSGGNRKKENAVREACGKLNAMLRAAEQDEDNTYKLFVGNLSFDIETEELRELCGHFGEVQDTQVSIYVDVYVYI